MKILGLSAFYHDSAAALIDHGKVISAAQEERFSRKKGDESFPHQSIDFCLTQNALILKNLDAIVYYEKPWLTFERLLESYINFAPRGLSSFLMSMPEWLSYKLNLKSHLKKQLRKHWSLSRSELPPLLFSAHHLSHAASAFYPSPFEDAAVLTIDGVGEWSTASAWHGQGSKLKPLWEIRFPHSLGLFYSAITDYCGFKINSGEYKLMGLAPYGKPRFQDLLERELIHIADDGSFRMNMKYFMYPYGLEMFHPDFEKLIGFASRSIYQSVAGAQAPMDQQYMDLAASMQAITEKIMLRLAKHLQKQTGAKNICLAGGVALNCVANGKISEAQIFDQMFIQPASGDSGGALGAALAAHHLHFKQPRVDHLSLQSPSSTASARPVVSTHSSQDQMSGALLGPKFSDTEIEMQLRMAGLKYQKYNQQELLQKTAQCLNEQMIVGWFQGAMEYGPRALGSRSILGDARNPDMKKIMNLKIKFRESFRPFAPAILAEKTNQYFGLREENPYMLLVGPSLFPEKFPSITHVDQSARVQSVSSTSQPMFYQLIKNFEVLTGCPMLINTSFNVRGEPIVHTPEDAINCFTHADIDVLCIGSFVVTKKENPALIRDEKWRDHFELD